MGMVEIFVNVLGGFYSINFIELTKDSMSSARGNNNMPNRYKMNTRLTQFSSSQVFS